MTRGVRPPFRRWTDLSDQQSTCAKVLIESSPWMRGVVHRSRWASHVLCRATHALIRGGRRIFSGSEVLLSGLVHVTTCACFPELRPEPLSSIFSRMARDASSTQSWRQLSRFWYRHPHLFGRGGVSSRLVIAWWQLACLIASRHCFVTVASMDGFHCSSSCTGGMTWSGSDVSLHQALTSLDPAMIHDGWSMASHGHGARIHGECGPAFVERQNRSRYRWRE